MGWMVCTGAQPILSLLPNSLAQPLRLSSLPIPNSKNSAVNTHMPEQLHLVVDVSNTKASSNRMRATTTPGSTLEQEYQTRVSPRRAANAPANAPAPPAKHFASAPADQFYGHEDTAKMCARFITHPLPCFDVPPATSQSTITLSLAHLVTYALHQTYLHASVTFCPLYLLSRLKNRFPAACGSLDHHPYISAFMIASKVICDDTYFNKSQCVVEQGMFTLREINQMEREMCGYLERVLNVKPEDLRDFGAMVRKEYSTVSAAPAAVPVPITRAPTVVEPRKQSTDFNANPYPRSPSFSFALQLDFPSAVHVPNTAI